MYNVEQPLNTLGYLLISLYYLFSILYRRIHLVFQQLISTTIYCCIASSCAQNVCSPCVTCFSLSIFLNYLNLENLIPKRCCSACKVCIEIFAGIRIDRRQKMVIAFSRVSNIPQGRWTKDDHSATSVYIRKLPV